MKKAEELQKERDELISRIHDIDIELERKEADREKREAVEKGYYVPLAEATVKYSIWYKSEEDFHEIGDGDWYTTDQLLGKPDFKKGTKVVLIRDSNEREAWYAYRASGDYYAIEDCESGMENTEKNDLIYLENILWIDCDDK